MRGMLALAIAAAGAALVLTTASAGPPPAIIVRVAVTHGQPAAGREFTGLAVTPVGARITVVSCDAQIGHKQLRGRQHRFYTAGVAGPAAVTCGWRIPAATGGKRLSLAADGRACVSLVQENGQPSNVCSPVVSWRIKP